MTNFTIRPRFNFRFQPEIAAAGGRNDVFFERNSWLKVPKDWKLKKAPGV